MKTEPGKIYMRRPSIFKSVIISTHALDIHSDFEGIRQLT